MSTTSDTVHHTQSASIRVAVVTRKELGLTRAWSLPYYWQTKSASQGKSVTTLAHDTSLANKTHSPSPIHYAKGLWTSEGEEGM